MNYASKLLESAIEEIAQLPGIGRKTALRLALHLLRAEKDDALRLSSAIRQLVEGVKYCVQCRNISDTEVCEICRNPSRDEQVICVVEDIQDVMAIENTEQYKGKYHILGGLISPMDGVGPSDLNIDSLLSRIESEGVKEIIFAIGATSEGDTTAFYIYKKISDKPVVISSIARGISVGDDLQYADEITLGRSISQRIPYEKSLGSV